MSKQVRLRLAEVASLGKLRIVKGPRDGELIMRTILDLRQSLPASPKTISIDQDHFDVSLDEAEAYAELIAMFLQQAGRDVEFLKGEDVTDWRYFTGEIEEDEDIGYDAGESDEDDA